MAAAPSHLSNCSLGDIKQLPSGWKWLLETQFKQGLKKKLNGPLESNLQEHLSVKQLSPNPQKHFETRFVKETVELVTQIGGRN